MSDGDGAAIMHELHLPALGPAALLVWELLFQFPLSSTTVPPALLGEPVQHSGPVTDWERQVMVCWERSRSGGPEYSRSPSEPPQVPALEIAAEPASPLEGLIRHYTQGVTKPNHCKEVKELPRPLLGTGKQQNGSQPSVQTNP